MQRRKHERFDFRGKVVWDFFTAGTGSKPGIVGNISRGGCLLKTSELIEHRRWIRFMLLDETSNVCHGLVGRIVRQENVIEMDFGQELTLHRYGVEFTFPGALSAQAFDLILALSSRNPIARSCLRRNEKSSLRPGFLS